MKVNFGIFLFVFICIGFLVDDAHCWRRRRCWASNCQYSYWGSWGSCSQPCGSHGTQTRERYITSYASCGGSCSYTTVESRACNRFCCAVNCGWSWSNWGTCAGCGNSTRSRIRVISVNPSCGGAPCPNSTTETESCDTGRCCSVNCTVSSWGNWGSCNAPCEKTGTLTRTRNVTVPASCNGTSCPVLVEHKSCNGPCCPRDCVLSTWSDWSTCNAPAGSCGPNSGSQARSRIVVTAQYCGGFCFPLNTTRLCTPVPIQCEVSQWGSWSTCTPNTGTCGAGTQIRTRTITQQPYCAPTCPVTSESRNCVHSCCPVSCTLSQWSPWGFCSANCGTGSQVRTRLIVSHASCGGSCSTVYYETQLCTVLQKIDCQLSLWSTWSICSSGCGNGLQQRSRTITRQPTWCGAQCGGLSDTKQCQSYRDNRDCQVGAWTAWGACNAKCSVGMKTRTRSVSVTNRCNGAACPSLIEWAACGLANGGCEHQCQTSNGACHCLPGYVLSNRTQCPRKNCGIPTIHYCPPGEANGTVCRQPWVTCPNGASVYETTCLVSCSSAYRLIGLSSIRCEADGDWTDGYKAIYCRRINDPPSHIILSGSHTIAENNAIGLIIGTLSSLDPNARDSHSYSLIADASYQGKFTVNGTQLHAQVQFDFETDSKSFLVGIKSTDNGDPPLSLTKYFTIRIDDVNERPTNIVISSTSVVENSDIGTAVGTFDTIDVDADQVNNYRLVNSANGMFRINANILEVARGNGICLVSGGRNCPLNFESRRTYSIVVESYDDKTRSFIITRSFNISVTDRNDPPFNMRLSWNVVKENAPIGTVIGQLTAEDEDENPKQTLFFTLTDDSSGRFAVSSDGTLTKKNGTDYETAKQHTIQVKVTDNGSPPLSNNKTFTILVQDVNEPPLNITITPSQPFVSENVVLGSPVCTVEAYDSDFVASLNLNLDMDAGGLFAIGMNQTCYHSGFSGATTKCISELLVNGPINYEKAAFHDISIRASDRGSFMSRMFKINVIDNNDAPTTVLINGKAYEGVPENNIAATVGTLDALDEDINQMHTFSIVGNGSSFVVDGRILKLADGVSFDYEAESVHTLMLNVTDNGTPSKSAVSSIRINVINVNEVPTGIRLTRSNIDENSFEDTVIANISVTDPDDTVNKPVGYHICNLIDSANGRFKIVEGLTLAVGSGELNYEIHNNHSVHVRCSDGELEVTKRFIITVNDVNEAPTKIALSNKKIAENVKDRFHIGTLTTVDPDNLASSRQSFSYNIVGSMSSFEVNGSSLYSKAPLNYETTPTLSVLISSTDTGKPALVRYESIRIEIIDKNDAPADILISGSVIDENAGENTTVGLLSTIDDDLNQRYTYSLIYNADGRFKIESKALMVAQSNSDCLQLGRSNCKLNYEETSSHYVTVEAMDNGHPPLSVSKNITIFLRNVNDQPRDIRLSNYIVNETAPVNFIIGKFSALDEDTGQMLTYVLTNNDDGAFGVDSSGNLYKATSKMNFETTEKHSITVSISDNGYPPLQVSKTFIIEVMDVNEAPLVTTIKKDGGQLEFPDDHPRMEENSDIDTVVGTVVSYESELVKKLTFELDDSANKTFGLESNTSCTNATEMAGIRSECSIRLLLRKTVNYERQSLYQIIIRTTDDYGLFHVQNFKVDIIDKNDSPTGVTLAGLKYVFVPENHVGAPVGKMTTVDEDDGQSHVYTLVGNNSGKFTIYGSFLSLSPDTVFDYERQTSFKVKINTTDSGRPPRSFVEILELRVRDLNEAPTSITLNGNKVPENSPVGTLIGNLSVEDPDNVGIRGRWQTHYCIISAGSFGLLNLHGMALVVAHSGIDYETIFSMNISVRCEDSGQPALFIEKWFIIEVENVNEKPTDVQISNSIIAENTPPGGIALLSTSDPDNAKVKPAASQSFSYKIMNDFDNLPFRIADRNLQTIKNLDYENQTSWTLTIRSTDSGIPPLFVEKTFIISVTDVNEQPYDISLKKSDVNENSGYRTLVGNLSSSDPDNGQSFSYTLENDASGLFRIENNQIKVAVDNRHCLQLGGARCKINYELQRSAIIRVRTEDSGNPKLSYAKDLTININDINDRPRDIRLSANILKENAERGFVIGQLTVTDEDAGQSITFRMTNDDNGRFALTGNSFISKAKSVNYESSKAHKVTIEAEDNGNPPLKIIEEFTIVIEDVNESPTAIELLANGGQLAFTKDAARINENSPIGTVVGTLVARDEDIVESLSFSLDDDAKGAFSVESTAVCINNTIGGSSLQTLCSALLKVSGPLNYEEDANKSIIVRVTDKGGLHHSKAFSISVLDQNDQPTNITLNRLHVGFVNENDPDTLIGTLETEDEDYDQHYRYRIIFDPGMDFNVSNNKIFAVSSASLNYEKRNEHTILIEVTDDGIPALSHRRNITIKILDVNEAPTSLGLSNSQVDENSPVGKAIANISVTDPDNEGSFSGRQSASCQVSFDTSSIFEVNRGVVLVVKQSNLDFERQSSYNLKLRCTDSGLPRKSVEMEVTVNVNDVNEPPSSITLTSGIISENQGPALVGRLIVSDPDRTPQTPSLSITDRTLPFSIIGNMLRTTKPLNFEQHHAYRLSIKAIDQGGLSVVNGFTIYVQDANDPPVDLLFSGPLSIQRNYQAGVLICSASAVDEDSSQTHTYAIERIIGERHGNTTLFTFLPGYFTIGLASGRVISVVSSASYEEYTAFNITVVATDNGSPPRSIRKTARILVIDVNRPPTSLTFSGRYVTENSPIGTTVGTFTITDPDNRISQRQTYSCQVRAATSGSVPFTISSKLSLAVNGEVNYEKRQVHALEVTCTEEVQDPYNITDIFLVIVRNLNEAPSGVNITSDTIAENLDPGSVIGNIYAIDPDNEATLVDHVTISIFPELDFAAFSLLRGNYLVSNQKFNYEQKNSFSIKILATDDGSPVLSSTQVLDIKIKDMNDQPSNISLSSSTISENSRKGSIIGRLSTIDEDSGQIHNFTIISTIDNLQVHGKQLIVSGNLNYETEPKVNIEISVTDSGNPPLSYQKSFAITITDVNDAPSDIIFTLYPVMENNTVNQMVTNLTLADEDFNQHVQYCSMIKTPGYFYLVTDSVENAVNVFIQGTAPLDYEVSPVFNVTLQCFDNGSPSLSVTKTLYIPVLDSNDAPTGIMVNGSGVIKLEENSPFEAVVGHLSCVDQDARQSHSYSLQSNTDIFMLNENSEILQVKDPSKLNYEALPSPKLISVRIKVVDNGKPPMSFTGAIQIEITDVNEAPSNVRMMHSISELIPENVTVGTQIGKLHADNPEGIRQQLTFEVLNWQDAFSVTESNGPSKVSYLTVKMELDYFVRARYALSIRVTDNGTPPLSAQGIVMIDLRRTDPCASGLLNCGDEFCQRISKTHGTCGCIDGYVPKEGKCVEVNDCRSNCLYCDDSIKACKTKLQCLPCDNNATCIDQLKSYKCTCLPGFTDERCKTNIDDCASKPCHYGTCFDLINSYRCECDSGYQGRNCTENINECARKECVKGDCTDLIDGFSCACTKGTWGLLCSRRESDCLPNKCGSDLCVPPAYKDSPSIESGGLEVLCAKASQVIILSFSSFSVPVKIEHQAKWKYLLRRFIITMVTIPYLAVDLSEYKSNAGFYIPTDVVFYPFKSSRSKRDTKSNSENVVQSLVVKVQDKLVSEASFLRAINKTCHNIRQSSPYWVFCLSASARIKELGITEDGPDNKMPDDESKILYIGIGGGGGGFLVILILAVIVIRARKKSEQSDGPPVDERERDGLNPYVIERHCRAQAQGSNEDQANEGVLMLENHACSIDDEYVEYSKNVIFNLRYGVSRRDAARALNVHPSGKLK